MGAFKAYDIRGVWGTDMNEEMVYKIGFFLPRLLDCKEILVGRDMRLSSDTIFEALAKGITDSGADVWTIGKSTTPMVYFATCYFKVGGSVQITASHNPKEYNGLKVSRAMAIPVGYDTGLADLEKMVATLPVTPVGKKGTIIEKDALTPYVEFQRKYVTDFSNLKLAVDCSNGMSSILVHKVLGDDNIIYINDHLNGSFPDHQPNPLEIKNCEHLMRVVRENHCDLGIIYDGDADRVNLVDEKGNYIFADITMAILGIEMLKGIKGGKVVADIRSSRSAVDYINNTLHGDVYLWKVGHVNAKAKIREIGAVYGGELAGHYYFRDFFNCDSAGFATLHLLPVFSQAKKEGKSASDLVKEIVKWATSGEINFRLEKKDEVIKALYDAYASKADKVLDFDGYRFDFKDWWFNVRKSNTEPYLRLVLEAKTPEEVARRVEEVKKYIHD